MRVCKGDHNKVMGTPALYIYPHWQLHVEIRRNGDLM
jgi:hypothetical protein